MRTVIVKSRVGTKSLGYLSVAIFALGFAQPAQAVDSLEETRGNVTTTAQLAFKGVTLDDIGTTYYMRGRMHGGAVNVDTGEVGFFWRTETKDSGGNLTQISYQAHILDADSDSTKHTKFVVVNLTNGDGGVYASVNAKAGYSANNKSYGTDLSSSGLGNRDYVLYAIELVNPATAINVNFTNGSGTELTTTTKAGSGLSIPAYTGAGEFLVPYSAWANKQGNNGSVTTGGATVKVSGSRGSWRCDTPTPAYELRAGYIDDSSSYKNPTITVTSIPYSKYRVIVMASIESSNIKFAKYTINGTDYTSTYTSGGSLNNDTLYKTVAGTSNWGSSGRSHTAWSPIEGVNYLVSPILSGSTATVKGNRSSDSVRCGIGAIQIVEIKTYTATVPADTDTDLWSLAWDTALPERDLTKSELVLNVAGNATVNVPQSVAKVAKITFNVADGATLTLSGGKIESRDPIVVNGPGTIVAGSGSQFSGTVTGNGTIVYGANPSGATFNDSAWTGVLWLKNGTMNQLLAQNLAGANSTLRLTGVTGYFNNGDSEMTSAGTLELVDDGATPAFTVSNGYSNSGKTVFAALKGGGTFKSDTTTSQRYVFKDVSAFTGTIDIPSEKNTRVILGNGASLSPANGTITVVSGATATIDTGKTWTAQGGIVVNGTLNLGAGATAPAVTGGTGTVAVATGTGTLIGYGSGAALTLATAPGATLVISDGTLTSMTVGAFNNLGTIDLTGTALTEATLNLASGVTTAATGTILYPTTLEKFVVAPADQSIRSLDGFTAPTLPEGVTYYVQVSETREEYGKGLLTVTDAASGVNVCVVRVADGSIVELTPEDGVVTISGAPLIAGAATAFDFTYTNTANKAYSAPGLDIGWNCDPDANNSRVPTFNNENADKTTGVHIRHHPWVTGAGNLIHDLDNFTIVLVGTMSPQHNTQFFHMGSTTDGSTGLLITTTENDNEVLIAKNTAGTVDAKNGVVASVSNAATARHAYVIYKKGTVFEVWVDGVKRGQFDGGEGFTLSAGGMQVGSDHGGVIHGGTANNGTYKAVPINDTDETGYLNVLRMFDYTISDAQAEAVFAEYPYVSQGGLYTRTVAADGGFSETDTWAKDGAAGTFAVPEGATVDEVYYNPSATLTVNAEATMTVNADATLEKLTVGGSAALTFAADGAHTISVVGDAFINSPVTNEYGAVYLAGAPVRLGSSGSICFDCSSLDVSEVYAVTRYQLTGLIDRDDARVTAIVPTDPDRTAALVYNATGSCYDLVVTPIHNYVVAENKHTSLAVTEDTIIVGAGGFDIASLVIPENARIVFDPVKTPIYVYGTNEGSLTLGNGVKFALAPAYSGMTLGRIILITYKEAGVTGLPANLNDIFDASSIASGATYAVTSEDAPDPTGGRKQLVLTVGDYDRDAKEIVVAAVGDSITQGVSNSTQGDYPQYRTSIAAHLAANGYKPKFRGIWCKSNYDAAHVQVPDDWAYHSGFGMAAIRTTDKSGGLADNMPLYLDIAGYPDVITLLIGTNDMGANGKEAGETFTNYVELVNATAAQRPNAKIVGATILPRPGETGEKVVSFNALLRAEYEKPGKGDLPENFYLVDLYPLVPNDAVASDTVGNYKSDNVHPNWKGNATIAEAFYGKIAELCPLATFAGAGDATVTDEEQTALGAANVAELAAYRAGMTHAFTIEKDGAAGATNCFTSVPYTTIATSAALTRPVSKVGYYMELVRKGTSRRRWVWVDMDATGMTLGEVDFPWNKANMQRIATKLHVKSNYAGIHDVAADDDSICGFVEGTMYNYQTPTNSIEGVPADIFGDKYGWNDTMGTSGGHACFQVHRIFSQTGADTSWNDAEVLFAWNKWGNDKSGYVDNIGIGTFACHVESVSGGIKTTDYTFTENCTEGGFADAVTSDAYSIRRLEIWATLDGEARHGVWSGLGANADFDTAANWEDGIVPSAGENIDFSAVPAATTISVTGASAAKTFGAVSNGNQVVTFTGTFKAASFSDHSKVAVGTGASVEAAGMVSTEAGYVTDRNDGEMTVDYLFLSGSLDRFTTANQGTDITPVFKFGCITNSMNGNWLYFADGTGASRGVFYIGAGGLNFQEPESGYFYAAYCIGRNADGDAQTLRPWNSDFTIADRGNDGTSLVFHRNATLCTDDESGTGRTVTIDARTRAPNASASFTVSGSGKVVKNAGYSNDNGNKPTVVVTNTATLAMKPGAGFGESVMTVNSGAMLEVAKSGTVTLGGDLALADDAILGFNFTDRRNAPVLAVPGSVTATGTIKVNVTASNSIRPAFGTDGKYVLTSGGKFEGKTVELTDDSKKLAASVEVNSDGEIVLTVKPAGTSVTLR